MSTGGRLDSLMSHLDEYLEENPVGVSMDDTGYDDFLDGYADSANNTSPDNTEEPQPSTPDTKFSSKIVSSESLRTSATLADDTTHADIGDTDTDTVDLLDVYSATEDAESLLFSPQSLNRSLSYGSTGGVNRVSQPFINEQPRFRSLLPSQQISILESKRISVMSSAPKMHDATKNQTKRTSTSSGLTTNPGNTPASNPSNPKRTSTHSSVSTSGVSGGLRRYAPIVVPSAAGAKKDEGESPAVAALRAELGAVRSKLESEQSTATHLLSHLSLADATPPPQITSATPQKPNQLEWVAAIGLDDVKSPTKSLPESLPGSKKSSMTASVERSKSLSSVSTKSSGSDGKKRKESALMKTQMMAVMGGMFEKRL